MRLTGRPLAMTGIRAAATLAAAGFLLAGCTNEPVAGPEPAPSAAPGSGPAQPPSSAPGAAAGTDVDPAALEWTSAVCTALTPLTERIESPPAPDLADGAATQRTFSSYLAAAVGDAEQAAADLAAAGAPPVEGGEEIAAAVATQVEELRADLAQAGARVDAADPADPIAVGRVAVGAGADIVGSLGEIVEVTTLVSDNQTLRPAFEQAPECASLRTVALPT